MVYIIGRIERTKVSMSKLIHRIWLGDKIPDKFEGYANKWRELNPEHELITWTEREIFDQNWINQSVLEDLKEKVVNPRADRIAYYTYVADVLCYELLYEYGGWYINCDLDPVRSLKVLNNDPKIPAFAMEDDVYAVNMAMYCPPGHPMFSRILEIIPERYFSIENAPMNHATGVGLISQARKEYNGEVTLFGRNVFNPIHFSEIPLGSHPDTNIEIPGETVAVHLWHHRKVRRKNEIL